MEHSFLLGTGPPPVLSQLQEPLDGEGPHRDAGAGVAQVLSLGAGMGPGPDNPSAADSGRLPAAPDHQVRCGTWTK